MLLKRMLSYQKDFVFFFEKNISSVDITLYSLKRLSYQKDFVFFFEKNISSVDITLYSLNSFYS